MAENTKIEWCDHTVNLWHGCTKVHAGCDNCYAEKTEVRWGFDVWGNDKPRKEIKSAFKDLARYQKEAQEEGKKYKVFVGSMMDIFEKPMPLVDSKGYKITDFGSAGYRELKTRNLADRFFENIDKGLYPNLIFLLLTKRPSNIAKYIPAKWANYCPTNVWFGTSVSDQKTANDLVPMLIRNAPENGNLFLSVEPQIGEIDLGAIMIEVAGINLHAITAIDWVIQGVVS